MIKYITSILFAFGLTSCDTLLEAALETPSTNSGVSSNQVLSEGQVARIFYNAYKNHDRAAASRVADSAALNKLSWSWDPVPPSNMRLEHTDNGYAIAYDGGAILLDIFSDGHVGANVADVRLIAD